MKVIQRRVLGGMLAGILILSGCSAAGQTALETKVKELNEQVAALTEQNRIQAEKLQDLETPQMLPATPLTTAMTVIQLLKNQDMAGLQPYIHPVKGVRFSPYGYVDTANHLLFTATQAGNLMTDATVYTWGSFDGSGDPIQMDFPAYYSKFIYDEDFINPHIIGNNTLIGTGNTLHNIAAVYPGAVFVEFHFTGFDPQYGGMDWRSLRLVFENVGGNWMLVGIVHDSWTS